MNYANPQLLVFFDRDCLECFECLGVSCNDLCRERTEDFTRSIDTKAPGCSIKEPNAQFFFQPGQLLRKPRLTGLHNSRCMAEVRCSSERFNNGEFSDVQACSKTETSLTKYSECLYQVYAKGRFG